MSDIRAGTRRHQAGYAIAAVSFIGMIAMAGAATMLSTAPVAEVAEIEESLLQIRAHWGSVGMLSYAISRGRQDGACGGDRCNKDDTDRRDIYQAYVEEIYNAKGKTLTTNKPSEMNWTYEEIDDEYFVQLQATVKDLDLADDGKLSFEIDPVDFGTFFDENRDKKSFTSAHILVEFCTGLAAAGDACLNSIAKTNTSGVSRLQDFRIEEP